MVYITGDTHGNCTRVREWAKVFGKDDTIIVAGDFGYLFRKRQDVWDTFQKEFGKLNCTVLFIDGNHENFNWLNEFEVDMWNGGKVHKILGDKVIHLMRGQVFNIEGKKIFTFGGGLSIDTQGGILDRKDPDFRRKEIEALLSGLPYRILNESWWKEEMPTEEEKQEAVNNLSKHNNTVDYVITHAVGTQLYGRLALELGIRNMITDSLSEWLMGMDKVVKCDKWYFGHYHLDKEIDNKYTALYYDIKKLNMEN